MRNFTRLFLSILFTLLPPQLHAQLEWQQVELNKLANATDRKTSNAFPFTNTGDYPVTIESTKPDCGCVVAALEKKRYEPGESGEIVARFNIGDRREKTILVSSGDWVGFGRESCAVVIPTKSI
jgi:hypothetical protein